MSVPVRVPLNVPSLGEREAAYVREALASGWITSGPFVERFEEAFARYVGRRYAVACSSGTAAVWLALKALGDPRLIAPAYTCDAIANAALLAGGRMPLVADCDFGTWGLRADEVKAIAREHALLGQAVLVAHSYGVPARDTEEIEAFCRSEHLSMIEDASEAHGASIGARRCGSFGRMSVFSLRGEKTLGAGQFGVVVTDDADLARRARQYAYSGLPAEALRFWSTVPAFNCQPSHLNAALACAQLERIDELVKARNEVHRRWRELFNGVDGIEFQAVHGEPAWWLTGFIIYPDFTSLLPQDIAVGLRAVGIETRCGFYPLHRLPHCRGANVLGACSVADLLLRQLLILPSGPELKMEQQEYVRRELFRLIGRCA